MSSSVPWSSPPATRWEVAASDEVALNRLKAIERPDRTVSFDQRYQDAGGTDRRWFLLLTEDGSGSVSHAEGKTRVAASTFSAGTIELDDVMSQVDLETTRADGLSGTALTIHRREVRWIGVPSARPAQHVVSDAVFAALLTDVIGALEEDDDMAAYLLLYPPRNVGSSE